MAIKRYKPTSAARRFMTVHAYDEITEVRPERGLVEDMRKSGGRNNQGKITVRHIGGGNRRKYRIIDFKRNKDGIPAKVKSIPVRPQPQREHRPSRVCRRRKEVHPRPRRAERRRHRDERRGSGHQGGQLPPL